MLLVLLVTGGGIYDRNVKAAIIDGKIGVSYCLRDRMGTNLIVVDESCRLLCVNGGVLGSDEVKKLTWHFGDRQHALEFALTSGTDPVRLVSLGDKGRLKQDFERLCNSLEATS